MKTNIQATVSIIVPVYNVEKYLPKCIESILEQTYSNFQLILVDDGSLDNCGAICDEYAARDSRIVVIHKKNGGVSSARNYGLSYVTGKYITFCDSDDQYAPEWIEKLVSAIEQDHADVAVGNYIQVFEDGTVDGKSDHATGSIVLVTCENIIQYCIDNVFDYAHGWEIWSRLFRAEPIVNNKIRFCETCHNYAEDLCFVLEYMMYAKKVISIDFAGYLYTQRQNSMMRLSVNSIKLDCVNEVSTQYETRFVQVFDKIFVKKYLPIMHYAIMDTEYQKMVYGLHNFKLKEQFKKIVNFSQWRKKTIRIFRCGKELEYLYNKYIMRTIFVFSYCYLFYDMPLFIFWCILL